MDNFAWKRRDAWTGKEFAALLLIEFVFVIAVLKYGVQSLYLSWFGNTFYAGTLTGLPIAVVLLSALYFIALRPQKLSWKEVGAPEHWRKIPVWLAVTIVLSIAALLLASLFGTGTDNSKTESLQQNITLFTVFIGIVSAGIISPVYGVLPTKRRYYTLSKFQPKKSRIPVR